MAGPILDVDQLPQNRSLVALGRWEKTDSDFDVLLVERLRESPHETDSLFSHEGGVALQQQVQPVK